MRPDISHLAGYSPLEFPLNRQVPRFDIAADEILWIRIEITRSWRRREGALGVNEVWYGHYRRSSRQRAGRGKRVGAGDRSERQIRVDERTPVHVVLRRRYGSARTDDELFERAPSDPDTGSK